MSPVRRARWTRRWVLRDATRDDAERLLSPPMSKTCCFASPWAQDGVSALDGCRVRSAPAAEAPRTRRGDRGRTRRDAHHRAASRDVCQRRALARAGSVHHARRARGGARPRATGARSPSRRKCSSPSSPACTRSRRSIRAAGERRGDAMKPTRSGGCSSRSCGGSPAECATRVSRWAKRLATSAARDAAAGKRAPKASATTRLRFHASSSAASRASRGTPPRASARAHFLGGEWCVGRVNAGYVDRALNRIGAEPFDTRRRTPLAGALNISSRSLNLRFAPGDGRRRARGR